MAVEVMVDTNYLTALLRRGDTFHEVAVAASARVAGRRLVTSDLVFVELLNNMAGRSLALRAAAIATARDAVVHKDIHVVQYRRRHLHNAMRRYEGRGPRKDAPSFVDVHLADLMDRLGINEILTTDPWFATAGYTNLVDVPVPTSQAPASKRKR